MNRAIAWAARNPVAANLFMLGVIMAGILGYLRMEREVFPTIRINEVEVVVAWPGAAPQEVEEQVVLRIEESLNDLDNVEHITSRSAEGLATISIEASKRVDMAQFVNEVKLRIDGIPGLPVDMERPQVREVVGREEMIRLAVHGDVAERELKRIAEGFRDELALLPGVSLVQLFGVRREEVSIELSREAMQRYGIGFDEVAAAVRGSSINLSSGVVRTETGDMQLRARNLADSAADFDRIVVRQVADGGTVRLADVAKVVDGFEDNEIRATLNGEQAVLLQVMSTDRMDVVKASESVNAWLEGARARLPKGMSLTMWWDSAEMYRDRMDTILGSALSGLALVFGVLMLSLRPKVALWVTAGIATAYIGTFALLPGMDVSINIMSTFAFMLVLGIVVDDAIVIGENIHTVNDEGRASGTAAAILGAQAVAKPVLYAVATTIIAFLPWFFLSGPEAQITRQISIVIVCALTISLMEAWFVLPAHLRHLPPRRDRNRLAQLQHGIESALGRFADTRYRAWLGAALERRWIVLCGFLAFFILSTGLLSSGWLKFTFMPDIEGDQLIVNVELPEGTPYSRALAILAQLQDAERRLEDEVNANGEGKRLIETWYTRSRRDSVIAIVKLVPPEERALSSKQAAERLRELLGEVPDAEAIQVLHSMGSTDPDMEYSVSHPDNEVLKHAVDALRERLAQYDNTYDVRDSLQDSTEELRLHLLPGAERMGLSLAEVSRQVRQAYYGQEVQRLPRDGNDVKVMVRYPRESRQNLHSLEQFRLRTADGREVPLLAVAEIEYRPGVQRLERRERQRSVVVSAELRDDVRHRIDEDLAKNFFPQWRKDFPGVTLGAVGAAEGEAEFMQEVTSLYAVALFVMYALIAVAFRSYWQPVIVMSAIPFGFMGAVYGHMLIDMPMALFSYFGIGAAAGVVVNDNLVLMDRINQLREEGLGPREALLEAGASRFRPILLTSVTTFVGLVPMMAAQSMQAQFLQPTVVSLAFGVLFATFVTLFFVPALYLVGENARARAARRRARAPLPRGAGVAEAG